MVASKLLELLVDQVEAEVTGAQADMLAVLVRPGKVLLAEMDLAQMQAAVAVAVQEL